MDRITLALKYGQPLLALPEDNELRKTLVSELEKLIEIAIKLGNEESLQICSRTFSVIIASHKICAVKTPTVSDRDLCKTAFKLDLKHSQILLLALYVCGADKGFVSKVEAINLVSSILGEKNIVKTNATTLLANLKDGITARTSALPRGEKEYMLTEQGIENCREFFAVLRGVVPNLIQTQNSEASAVVKESEVSTHVKT